MRVIAGTLKGRRLDASDVGRAAADVGQAAGDAVQHPGAAHGRRARARRLCRHRGARASRRSVAARRTSPSSSSDPRAQALIADNLAHCRIETGYTVLRVACGARSRASADRSHVRAFRHHAPRSAVRSRRRTRSWPARMPCSRPAACSCSSTRAARAVPASSGRLVQVRQVRSGDSMLTMYLTLKPNLEPNP